MRLQRVRELRPLQAHSEDHGPIETDFLVIGAGIAGLRAAIELAEVGHVLVLAKQEVTESATHYAQGGIAVVLSDEDEISLHLRDTLNAGDGLCNLEAAEVLVEEGPARIEELIAWGTQFDRRGTKLSFTREGAHSRARILHAHGDSTGQEIGRALCAKARMLPRLSIREFSPAAQSGDQVIAVGIGNGRELRPFGYIGNDNVGALDHSTGLVAHDTRDRAGCLSECHRPNTQNRKEGRESTKSQHECLRRWRIRSSEHTCYAQRNCLRESGRSGQPSCAGKVVSRSALLCLTHYYKTAT